MPNFVLNVGKVDAGVALLQTHDFNVTEFPAILLPENTAAGHIVEVSVSRNQDAERSRLQSFLALQKRLYESFSGEGKEQEGNAVNETNVQEEVAEAV